MEPGAHATPEEAALAEWSAYPTAGVRVVAARITDDEAIVITDHEPSHLMWNHCRRTSEGWVYVWDHNGNLAFPD